MTSLPTAYFLLLLTTTAPLSLNDAVRRAAEQSLDVVAARARNEQTALGERQAKVGLLPTLGLQGKYTHNYKKAQLSLQEFFAPTQALAGLLKQNLGGQDPGLAQALQGFSDGLPQLSPVTIQRGEQLDATLSLTVPILAPTTWYNVWAAKGAAAAGDADFAASRNRTLLAVAQAFFMALGQDEIGQARQDAVEVAEVTVRRAASRFAAGTVKRTDVTQAELTLLQARQALVQAGAARRQAYRQLATLLQVPADFVVTAPELPSKVPQSADLLQEGAQRRPELAAYSKTLGAYEDQLQAQSWRGWPSLSGFGSAHIGNYAGFTGDLYAWAAGLQLDWALYDGGAHAAQAELVRAQMREAQASLAAQQQSIRDTILNALDELQTRRLGLSTAEDSQKLAHTTLTLSRVEYDSGTAMQLDVLQAQDALINAKVALAQARFDLGLAWIVLRQAAGLFPEDML